MTATHRTRPTAHPLGRRPAPPRSPRSVGPVVVEAAVVVALGAVAGQLAWALLCGCLLLPNLRAACRAGLDGWPAAGCTAALALGGWALLPWSPVVGLVVAAALVGAARFVSAEQRRSR